VAHTWLEHSLPLLALPEFAPDPELSTLLSWTEKPRDEAEKRAWGPWHELVAYWRSRTPRLTRSRQVLVRAVAARSIHSGFTRTGQLLHEWFAQVNRAWFHAVEQHASRRKLDVLQAVVVPGTVRPRGGKARRPRARPRTEGLHS
jgi:hypothetical protein